jgi:hypothetical protein
MADNNVFSALEKKLQEAKTAYDPFDPIKRPSGLDEPTTVLYDGKQITKSALKKIVADLQKQVDTIAKAANPVEDKAKALREEVAKDELLEERGAPGKRLTAAQRQEKLNSAKTLEGQASKIKETGKVTTAAPTKTVAPAVTATKKAEPKTLTPAMTAAKAVTPEAAAIKKPAVVTGGGGTTTGGRTTTGGGTGGTGGKGGKGGTGGKPGAKKPSTDWSTIVQQEFGPLWDVYNTNPDVKKVLDDAVAGGYQNDEVQMAEKLRGTTWFQTTERSSRQFAIRQSTDPAQVDDEINKKVEDFRATALANGFTFDDATLRKLATDSTKYGWSATQTQNAVGSEAVAQAQGRGAQGMKDLRSGTLGQNLRKIAAGYAQKPSEATFDQFVIEIMNGTKTETQFTDAMRESAKSQFRSLQPGLDKGSDVDTLLAGYKQQAAQVLGTTVDTSQIDWTSDKWNKALNYRDEKTNEYRQMDLWEWNKYLRTLPEWQNTDDAKQTYQNVAYSLAKGFGRIPQ